MSTTTPETAHEAALATSEAQTTLVSLRALPVTMENAEMVASILRDVKARSAALEARQKAITAPMRAAEKSVRDLFRPALTALAEAETILKSGLAGAAKAAAAANAAAMQAAETALAAGDGRGAALAAQSLVSTAAPAGVSMREVWRFSVTDENAVPRELCSSDPAKIKAFVAAYGDSRPIPGVVITKDVQVASRS